MLDGHVLGNGDVLGSGALGGALGSGALGGALEESPVNEIAASYFLFKGMCLRCLDRASAVTYKGTYNRREVGVPAASENFLHLRHGHPSP